MFVKILVFTSVFLIILWLLVQNLAYFLVNALIRNTLNNPMDCKSYRWFAMWIAPNRDFTFKEKLPVKKPLKGNYFNMKVQT